MRNRRYPLLATTWTKIALVIFRHVEQFQSPIISQPKLDDGLVQDATSKSFLICIRNG